MKGRVVYVDGAYPEIPLTPIAFERVAFLVETAAEQADFLGI